jgi:receptor-type tyrosine-protein phosphatase beta
VTSWPATADVTLKPLPVNSLEVVDESNGVVTIMWSPDAQSTQDEYRISYHEVDGTSNGDSSTMNTDTIRYVLENLLPGRNYSITVQAISKKMESNESTIYISTRPSAPIIEDLKSIREGLNISWKSDVNSKQEQYEVTYTRNETGETRTVLTKDTRLVFKPLHPGAGYIVKVFALSNGLRSEPHEYFQAVCEYKREI